MGYSYFRDMSQNTPSFTATISKSSEYELSYSSMALCCRILVTMRRSAWATYRFLMRAMATSSRYLRVFRRVSSYCFKFRFYKSPLDRYSSSRYAISSLLSSNVRGSNPVSSFVPQLSLSSPKASFTYSSEFESSAISRIV